MNSIDIDNLFTAFPSEEDLRTIIMHTSATSFGNELSEKDIENWLNNFKGEFIDIKYERLLALWLLSHFTYYNKKEVQHLCKVMYSDLIHLIADGDTTSEIEKAINSFFSKANIISAEEISGSGGFVAYLFRQENSLPIKELFNFSLSNIGNDIENIIVIDDVTLSVGIDGQKYKFWKKAKEDCPDKHFFLLTLIASEASIKDLETTFGLTVVSAIKLDNRDKCFSTESDIFFSFPDIVSTAKEMAEYYGKKIAITDPLGYNDGQYTFGFYYNTPDNSLPIFWGQKNGWIPVIRRYHKNYHTKKYLHNERFI